MTKDTPHLHEVPRTSPRPSWGTGFAQLPHLAEPSAFRRWYAQTSLLVRRTPDALPRLERKAA